MTSYFRYIPVRRPALATCLAFISGLLIGRRFEIPFWVIFSLLAALSVLIFLAIRRDRRLGRHDRAIVFLLLGTCLGITRYELFESRWLENEGGVSYLSKCGGVLVDGIVNDTPTAFVHSPGCRFPITNVTIAKEGRRVELKSGLQVLCRFPLSVTPEFQHKVRCIGSVQPIRANSLPGEHDYRGYYASRDIYGQVYIADPEDVEIFGQDRASLISLWNSSIYRLRVRILRMLRLHVGEPWWRLGASMFLGERSVLPEQFEEDMLAAGVYHITAVSGLHTTFLVSLFLIILKVAGLKRRAAALCMIPGLLVFLTLVGWRVPAVRASILALGLVGGLLFKKDSDPLNMLGLAALSILLVRPMEVFQPGFQQSFLAVASLMIFFPSLIERIGNQRWILKIPLAGLLSSFIIWLCLSPLLAYYFGDFALMAPISNVLIVPLASLVMAAIVLLIPFGLFWPSAASLVAVVPRLLLMALGKTTAWFAHLRWSNIDVARPGVLTIACFTMILFLSFAKRESLEFCLGRFKVRKVHLICCTAAIFAWSGFFCSNNVDLSVYFLSVGNGDSAIVQAPGRGTILIDGGVPDKSRNPKKETRLLETLRALGISEIDCMILTHADSDHIGDFQSVVENMPVEMFVTNPRPDPIHIYEDLIGALKYRSVPIHYAVRGSRIVGFPGLAIDVLSPTADLLNSPSASDNETSLVIRLSYKEMDFLFTGDATSEVESALIEDGAMLDSEFLKVGHHGSKYSSSEEFLERVTPNVSIVSVGRNPYRHPHKEAVERLREHSFLVLRTDNDGTIRISTDGHSYTVEPWIRKAIYTNQ